MKYISLLLATILATTAFAATFDETLELAKKGDSVAQFNLAWIYANGEGVPENDALAVNWYRKAANQGYANAQSNLVLMYDNGEGVPENDALAVKWYRKAADQGDVNAQFNLGLMYANGEGVPENDAVAVKWFRKAADQGYPSPGLFAKHFNREPFPLPATHP